MNYENLLLTQEEAETIAKKYYGITATATLLPGFEDINFKLQSDQDTYLLKISRPHLDEDVIGYQHAILEHLSTHKSSLGFPQTINNLQGHPYFKFRDKNNWSRFTRLQSWVHGKVAVQQKVHDSEFLQSWGSAAGKITVALQDFDHPNAHANHDWDLSNSLSNRQLRQYINNSKILEIADYFWDLFENKVLPQQPYLRKSIIHGDLNDYNVLTDNNTITGIIDFGDSVYSHTINELAVAIAYATMFKPNPLEAAANLVKGFNSVYQLQDRELELLYPLVANRLLMTATYAAKNRTLEPENTYLFVSEQPAYDVLKKWYKIPANLAYYTFRHACQLEPCPKRIIFDEWFSDLAFAKIVDFGTERVMELDLSVRSLDLGNNSNFSTPRRMQKKIDDILWEHQAVFGIGGYGEIRPFYNADAYIIEGNNGRQWRTCHIGLDIWAKEATPVYAAFEGTVFSIQDNKGDDNYGPTIILEHRIHDDFKFYTLYGHLSPIERQLKVGQFVGQGQEIATIGTYPQNGNWAEHLHFQIILDLLEEKGDFFGVCLPEEKVIWLSICPNITEKLSIPRFIKKSMSQSIETAGIIQKRQHVLGKNLSLSYKKPLHIVRAFQQFLYDEHGRRYLDTVNNVAHVGHQHPAIVKAGQRQIEVLNTNTRYLHQNIIEYSEELLATFPDELCVVYFVNSGSEANELALRMAKTVTNQEDFIAVEVGYHGNTNETIAVSSYKFDGKGGKGKPDKTHIVPKPDTFRGQFKNPDTAGKLYANFVKEAIETVTQNGRNVAGFICESILSCGGQIVLPKGYLKEAYTYVRESGGVCIADEVQVGFGRVGEKFWGFELQDVIPDIVTLGKPIGNGHPIGAVVTTRQIADAFDNGMEYFNTFGGNPVSCIIGKTVLEVIQNENLQQQALDVGNYLKDNLKALQHQFPIIGEVRGVGLFLGIELVRDKVTLEAADTEANYIVNRMRDKAILMSTDGPLHNVLKIKPPMCFTQKDADFLVATLAAVLLELQ